MSADSSENKDLNRDLPDEQTTRDETDALLEEEEYSFMKETVKRRPVSLRAILNSALLFCVIAVLFGLISGAVFRSVVNYHKDQPAPISIPTDVDVTETPALTGEAESGSSSADSGSGTEAMSAESRPAASTTPSESRPGNGQASVSSDAGITDPSEGGSQGAGSSSEGGDEGSGRDAGSGSNGAEGTPGAGQDPSSGENEGTPQATPVPTPVLTEEEQEELAYLSYRRRYTALKRVAEKASGGIVTVTGYRSTSDLFNMINESWDESSGIIVADNGQVLMILTNHASIDGAERIVVTFSDGSVADAVVRKTDPVTGLTVVTVDTAQLSQDTASKIVPADLGNSFSVSRGDAVIAVGSPSGVRDSIAFGTITSMTSTISLTDREYNLLATDIVGTGDSTGVLLNLDGEVVGFITQQYSPLNGGTVTALPISLLKSLIEKLSNEVPLPYTGIHGETITRTLSETYGVPTGVLVTQVEAESPALEAGVMSGDIITSIDGLVIASMRQVQEKLYNRTPGTESVYVVQRLGAEGYVEFSFHVTVGELP